MFIFLLTIFISLTAFYFSQILKQVLTYYFVGIEGKLFHTSSIYDNYTSKIITLENWDTIKSYIKIGCAYVIFKIRNFVTQYTESGKVEDLIINNQGYSVITYYRGDEKYKLITPKGNKGPRSIVSITDCFSNNVIEKVHIYLGPYGNFHGLHLTPKMMNLNSPIKIGYRNGITLSYDENEFIILNPTKII
jgi:hypothetical protein